MYRAKHALADYGAKWPYAPPGLGARPAATRPPLPPPTRRDRLNALDGARRVDAACLLWASVATKGVERRILVDALGTLVGSAAAQDVANLAPFVRQGLYAGLRDAALRDEAENQSLDDRRVLAALPPVPAGGAGWAEASNQPPRGPLACWPKPTDDQGRGRTRGPTLTAVSRRAAELGGQEVLTLAPDEAPAALRDEAPQKADDLAKLRQPRPGEGVEVFDSVFTVVVDAAPHVVRLKPFAGINGEPYFGHAAVDRKSLWWDPRGWWRHVHAAKQQTLLFRAEQRARLHRVNDSARTGADIPAASASLTQPYLSRRKPVIKDSLGPSRCSRLTRRPSPPSSSHRPRPSSRKTPTLLRRWRGLDWRTRPVSCSAAPATTRRRECATGPELGRTSQPQDQRLPRPSRRKMPRRWSAKWVICGQPTDYFEKSGALSRNGRSDSGVRRLPTSSSQRRRLNRPSLPSRRSTGVLERSRPGW